MTHLQYPFAPVPVNDVLTAFPGDIEHLIPAEADIPEGFWNPNHPYQQVAAAWLFVGLNRDVEFHMQEGIDGSQMFRHMTCVLGSYQYQVEYKLAAAAFLFALWCKEIVKWQKPPTS